MSTLSKSSGKVVYYLEDKGPVHFKSIPRPAVESAAKSAERHKFILIKLAASSYVFIFDMNQSYFTDNKPGDSGVLTEF